MHRFTRVYRTGLLTACLFVGMLPVSAQTVIQHDFEDGGTQGWGARGPASVTNSSDAAHGGTHSLLTTGRTQSWNGPSLNVAPLLSRDVVYRITAWVRLVSGQAASTLIMSVQRREYGVDFYDRVVSSANNGVTDQNWVRLEGYYVYNSDPTGLSLYIESSSGTSSFYLDDVSIAARTEPACDNTPILSTFESGQEGWQPRGGAISQSSADAHTGSYSLLASNRTNAWNGPSLDVTGRMCYGYRYTVSAWVKMVAGAPDTQLRLSVQRGATGATTYHTVAQNRTVTAAAWTQLITVVYYPLPYDTLSFYVESGEAAAPFASFYVDDVRVEALPQNVAPRTDIPSIKEEFPDFPVGAAVWSRDTWGMHADLLRQHFNSITPEDDTKWTGLQPREGNFTYTNADLLVNFALANNMRVRGHALVWGSQTPAWVFQNADRTVLLQRMQTHIQNVLTHFGANIYAWDVVNEATDPSQPDCLLRNQWYNIIGPDYIDYAFTWARQYAPAARLFINEFETTEPVRRECIYNLVRSMQQRGIPIDGIGHQLHSYHNNYPPPQAIVTAVNRFDELGVDQQITELEMSVYPGGDTTSRFESIGDAMLVEQGYRFRDTFQAIRQVRDKLTGVTLWGQADDHTWRHINPTTRKDWPLPFDQALQPKYAFWGIVDPLELPGADIAATIAAGSPTAIAGAPAVFTITVTNNGRDAAANVTMTSSVPAGMVFQSLAAPAGWTCTAPAVGAAGDAVCTAPAMANGATAQFTLTTGVACSTGNGARIALTATANSATRDPNPAPNNTATATVEVQTPVLSASNTARTGPANARVWTMTLRNTGAATATAAQIASFNLTLRAGAACTPVVIGPAFPASLGPIAAGGSANANVTIDFSSCAAANRYTLAMPYASGSCWGGGTLNLSNLFR